jgi:hypothetical protein
LEYSENKEPISVDLTGAGGDLAAGATVMQLWDSQQTARNSHGRATGCGC